MKVLIPMVDGMEEMEAVILTDVLRRAGIQVTTASLHPDKNISSNRPISEDTVIRASRNTFHLADTSLESLTESDIKDFDMILLPGGLGGSNRLNEDPRIPKLLSHFRKDNKWIGAICAAPKVLLHHGFLEEGDKYTAYPGSTEEKSGYTGEFVEKNTSKNIITGKGPGSAFSLALSIIEEFLGEEKSIEVKSGLQIG